MRFLFIRSENLVTVDNAVLSVNCASLPTNVEIVVYQEINGKIEYNDRPSVRTKFTDPSPYQTLLNSWITAAAAQIPALQLAQAKQVKTDLIEAIMHHKRRLPYTHTASGWIFDASDDNVAALDLLAQNGIVDSSGLVASINTALTTLVSYANINVDAHNASDAIAGHSQTNSSNIATLFNNPTVGWLWAPGQPPNPGTVAFTYATAVPGVSVSGGGVGTSHTGTITHQPLNATTPQTIQTATIYAVLQAIANRRNTLNTNRMAKQAAVNALTTIPAIVAYDATAGWSF